MTDIYIRVALVISQQHVITRPQLLDQVTFQQQGFRLGVGNRYFDARNLLDQCTCFGIQARLAKIAGYPFIQITGLAHIQRRPFAIQHPVDAGARRQCFQELTGIKCVVMRCHQWLPGTPDLQSLPSSTCRTNRKTLPNISGVKRLVWVL